MKSLESIRKMVEAGESEYLWVLKTRNLLIFRDAKNAEHGKIAPSWNVSGTRRLLIFDSAMIPAPPTIHGRSASFRNMGNSFTGGIFSLRSRLARISPAGTELNVTYIYPSGQALDAANLASGEAFRSQECRHFKHAHIILALGELRSCGIVDDEVTSGCN